MPENTSKSKAVIYFLEFLLFVGAFGGIIALINMLLRKYGLESPYTKAFLIAVVIFVYYKAWKWMCRKLDIFNSNNKMNNE